MSYGISPGWAWHAARGVLLGGCYAELQTRWEAFLLLLPGAGGQPRPGELGGAADLQKMAMSKAAATFLKAFPQLVSV